MDELLEAVAAWEATKKHLETIKEAEMLCRNRVVKLAFPNPVEGTQKLELGDGWSIKLSHKMNYTLADNARVDEALSRIAATGNEGKFLAERLVNWKPSLSLSEYRELEPQYKGIIDAVLTIKPAAPSLEIVEPKSK